MEILGAWRNQLKQPASSLLQMTLDPSLVRKMVKQSENLEIEEGVFVKFQPLLVSVSEGLTKSQVKVSRETEPCFFRIPG